MDGFERRILVDRWVQEQELAKNCRWMGLSVKFWQIDEFKSNGKKLIDGWVWVESFGRQMDGSAKPQIEHMYPPKYQVPPG